MGQICAQIIKDAQFEEVSFVEHPADKRCIAFTAIIDGIEKDMFTWRRLDQSQAKSHVVQ